jgi:hypothetical protein
MKRKKKMRTIKADAFWFSFFDLFPPEWEKFSHLIFSSFFQHVLHLIFSETPSNRVKARKSIPFCSIVCFHRKQRISYMEMHLLIYVSYCFKVL